jgi:hypothetical protein
MTIKKTKKSIRELVLEELENDETGMSGQTGEEEEEVSDGTFEASSIDDFLKKTNTTVTMKKMGCEISPIFNTRDYHNKYRVFVSNPKGKTNFVFWDSVKNTQDGTPTDKEVAFAMGIMDAGIFFNYPDMSPGDFKAEFGYTDDKRANTAYKACKKAYDRFMKMYTNEEFEVILDLAYQV